MRSSDHTVAGIDEAEVTVECVLTVENGGGSAGGIERGGELVADVSRFTDTDDDDLGTLFNSGLEGFHGGDK